MRGHFIVCGDDALARRIVDVLTDAELTVVALRSPSDLGAVGVSSAQAVICVSPDDALNLEVALLARRANPGVRVVARLANSVLREAMNDGNEAGAVLDVADLAAPSVVEALLGRTAHTIRVGSMDFLISGASAAAAGTVRDLYGHLLPVAIIRGDQSPTPGDVIACPGLDEPLFEGDWTVVIGQADELSHQGVKTTDPAGSSPRQSWVVRFVDGVRAFHDDVNPTFYRALALAATLLIGSAVLLRLAYRDSEFGLMDALSFATETLTTVGYGDFSFTEQPIWLRLWGVVMMLSGVAMNAILVAFIADVLLSRRISQAANRQRVSHLRDHFIVVGVGSFGVRVASLLKESGHDVVAIERDEGSRYLSTAAELNVPVILGDATLRTTLTAAGADRARAIAVLTEDDMVNIETGIVLREMIGPRSGSADKPGRGPIVLRIYDRTLGKAVGHRFGFEHVRSTVDLATPWFIGAAMGLEVLGTFSVGQNSFMVGGVRVRPNSELDGATAEDLSTQTRLIAVDRDGAINEIHAGQDARLRAGDTAYLVGPYDELLETLRRGERAGPVRPARGMPG